MKFSRVLQMFICLRLERSWPEDGLVRGWYLRSLALWATSLPRALRQQEDNKVIRCGLVGHAVLRLQLEISIQASALEGIDKFSTASQATHAPK